PIAFLKVPKQRNSMLLFKSICIFKDYSSCLKACLKTNRTQKAFLFYRRKRKIFARRRKSFSLIFHHCKIKKALLPSWQKWNIGLRKTNKSRYTHDRFGF